MLVDTITCVSCWHRFKLHELLWIAKHPDHASDPVAGPEESYRFVARRFTPEGDARDPGGWPSQDVACPRCHLHLPRVFAKARPLTFSLVGVTASAKTYFLVTMTRTLRERLRAQFGLGFEDADTVGNEVLLRYEGILFDGEDREKVVALPKTQSLGDHHRTMAIDHSQVRLVRPLLFRMQRERAAKTDHWVICLYDNAGEDFRPDRDDATQPVTQHVAGAKVLMFLYDPLQCPRFRERARARGLDDPQLDVGWKPEKVPQGRFLTHMAQRVRQHASVPERQKLEQPLIVLVSKSDVWRKLVPDEDLVTEPVIDDGRGEGGARLDVARIERVSRKVRALLASDEMDRDFVNVAETICSTVVYIPVSPLGGSPERIPGTEAFGVRPRNLAPRWVTVPLLYSFAKFSNGKIVAMADGRA